MLIIPYWSYTMNEIQQILFSPISCSPPSSFHVFLIFIYIINCWFIDIWFFKSPKMTGKNVQYVRCYEALTHQVGSHLVVDNSSIAYINTFILWFEEWCDDSNVKKNWNRNWNRNWNSNSHYSFTFAFQRDEWLKGKSECN